MAYINIPYQNSAAYNAVVGATTAAQLLNRKRYTLGAIEHHAGEGNAEQVSFFKSDLALIEERLTKLAPDALRCSCGRTIEPHYPNCLSCGAANPAHR